MTREELFSLADKVGLGFIRHASDKDIEKFEGLVKLVAFNEREACAKVCDSLEEQCEKLLVPDEKWPTPADCAHIIRARGQA
jgi:hypothetical protein